jgi:hypothetical protein
MPKGGVLVLLMLQWRFGLCRNRRTGIDVTIFFILDAFAHRFRRVIIYLLCLSKFDGKVPSGYPRSRLLPVDPAVAYGAHSR